MRIKYTLDEDEVPTHWYNIVPDLKTLLVPPLNPATRNPLQPSDLSALLPTALIEQGLSTERYVPIPEPVRDVYKQWRPTPLFRAHRLERALNTPAHIYTSITSTKAPAPAVLTSRTLPCPRYTTINRLV